MWDKNKVRDAMLDAKALAKAIAFDSRSFAFEVNANYVFVGIRRAGKSFLMYQRMHELIAAGHSWDEILYVNFEDERLSELEASELNVFLEVHYELYNVQPILFLDEIQNIAGWEKFARRMADMKHRVYITGSNAKMLSGDVATTLGGRFLIQDVYPYSFAEFCAASGVQLTAPDTLSTAQRGELLNRFAAYFKFGGFPESLIMADKRGYLTGLFQKIYLGDICARYAVSNSYSLRIMIKKLAESVKQPISYNRIANILGAVGIKIGVSTVINYVKYAEESWLVLRLQNYAAKLAEKESTPKYYFCDNGLLMIFLTDPATSLLENLVADVLFRRYGREDAVFFYHDGIEVDFYVPDEGLAVQVCYSLGDEETKKREVRALKKLTERFGCERLMIVTYDEEAALDEGGLPIAVVPAWKFALAMAPYAPSAMLTQPTNML